VQPSVFAAGSVMDSGTIITRLPPTAYAALSSAFRAGMTQYTRARPQGILDTCYDFGSLTTVSVPTVELVFDGGAVVDLDFDGIMVFDRGAWRSLPVAVQAPSAPSATCSSGRLRCCTMSAVPPWGSGLVLADLGPCVYLLSPRLGYT
jgi:hypothetical protein